MRPPTFGFLFGRWAFPADWLLGFRVYSLGFRVWKKVKDGKLDGNYKAIMGF